MLVLALLTLAVGQSLPIVQLDSGLSKDRYSVLGGIVQLFEGGDYLIGTVLFLFSFLLPIVKLVTLWALWFRVVDPEDRRRDLRVLRALGKWSMLDAFVAMTFAGTVQLGLLAKAQPEPGIYFFSVAIVLSIAITAIVSRAAQRAAGTAPPVLAGPTRHRPLWMALAALLVLAFGASLFLPVMRVTKWKLWSHEFSLYTGVQEILKEGEPVVGLALLLFVVLLPFLYYSSLAVLTCLRPDGAGSRRAARWFQHLAKWSMFDVFGLAILVVFLKVSDLVTVEPRIGMLVYFGAIALSTFLTWRVQRGATLPAAARPPAERGSP